MLGLERTQTSDSPVMEHMGKAGEGRVRRAIPRQVAQDATSTAENSGVGGDRHASPVQASAGQLGRSMHAERAAGDAVGARLIRSD